MRLGHAKPSKEYAQVFHSRTKFNVNCPGLATLSLVVFAAPVLAGDDHAAMQGFVDDTVMAFAQAPEIIAAVAAQNAVTAGYDQAKIDALDVSWQAEIGAADQPTIAPVLDNAASDFLRAQVETAKGTLTEVFVMDAQGLNVAASGITSDYWQGDEAKFQETYPNGAGAIHFGDIEFDESTNSYQAQISLTLSDPASGEAIGAMTVGVNAEAF